MKILVTGGAGFIGSNLAQRLLTEGHSVTVLDNLQSGYRVNLEALPGVRFVEGDVRKQETVLEAAEGAKVIFHLAASVGNKRSIDMPLDDAKTNVLGTLTVLETARRLSIPKVVFSSSAGIFGELKTLPIREDHPAGLPSWAQKRRVWHTRSSMGFSSSRCATSTSTALTSASIPMGA